MTNGWKLDRAERDLSTTVLGMDMPAPVILGPVGRQALAHPDGEIATARAAAAIWVRCPCTPPFETTPIRCAVPPVSRRRATKAPMPVLAKKLPSSMARSIWPRSIATTRPAPMLVCPTSELPICPRGSPTSGPKVTSVAFGHSARSRS